MAHICKEVSETEIEEPCGEPIGADTPPELVEPKRPPRRAGSAYEGLAGVAATIQERGDGRLFPKAKSIVGMPSKCAVP